MPCWFVKSCESCDFVGRPQGSASANLVQPCNPRKWLAKHTVAADFTTMSPDSEQCNLRSVRRLDKPIASNLRASASCVDTAVGSPRSFQCNMCTKGASSVRAQPATMHQDQVLSVAFAGRNEANISNDSSTSGRRCKKPWHLWVIYKSIT